MNHSEIQARLSDYLEGDLPATDSSLVASHLQQCDACARELDALRAMVELLHSLPTPDPPRDLAQSVMRRLERGEGRQGWFLRLGSALAQLVAAPVALPVSALVAVALVVAVAGVPDFRARVTTKVTTAGSGEDLRSEVRRDANPSALPGSRSGSVQSVQHPTPRGMFLRPEPIRETTRSWPRPIYPRAFVLVPEPPSRLLPVASKSLGSARASLSEYSRRTRPATPAAVGGPEARALRRERELDRRLDLLLLSPGDFVRDFGANSVAAQELWVVELVERALDRGITGEVLEALRQSDGFESLPAVQLFATAVQRAATEHRSE